ncbi:hypothetical protein E4634_00425 [Mangrovimicrobium sediminis]|uniref:Uncharacterized protein n=1 Tax=Mangrovimicrobium sediminis TaxID=2562682 RepID=A0A4Z0M8L1_9GAMM|nr:hypothetical protein [Haliea sp. SAOS-164]TGD76052.1 hypothetical protein E4634_00425 [Haliea sp. SAOS-164]
MEPEKPTTFFGLDWRIALGFAVSFVWITGGFLYLASIVGLSQFIHLPTADIGSFLEGAFAPLAFLWLVIGHFMQQKEIVANTRAIFLQEQSARRQEMHAQRDSFFKLQTLVQDQLGSIAAFHYMSLQALIGTEDEDTDALTAEQTLGASSDSAWFIRKMIALAVSNRQDQAKMHEIFFGTELRERHSDNYIKTFRKLLRAAEAVDTDNMVSEALLHGSPAGILYRIILMVQGEQLIDSLMSLSNEPGSGRSMAG